MLLNWIIVILCILNNLSECFFFCHSLCGGTCSQQTSGDCITCPNGFITTSCTKDPLKNYVPFGRGVDILSGEISFSTTLVVLTHPASSVLFPSPSTVSCGSLSYYGRYGNGDQAKLTITSSSTLFFYMIRIRFAIITIDKWDITSNLRVRFKTPTTQNISYFSLQNSTINMVCDFFCQKPAQKQCYKVIDVEYNYTLNSQPLEFYITAMNNSKYNPWGLKNAVVYARICHIYCQTCFGDTDTNCNSCVSPYKLSNTTCAPTCLSGYGDDTTLVCIKCTDYCTNCTNVFRYCQSCQVGYYLYAIGLDRLCVNICPNGTFINGVDCTPCTPQCANCVTATNCLSCLPGSYLNGNTCGNSCPVSFTFDSTTWKCLPCITSCTSQFKCPAGYYLNGNVCVVTCPIYNIPSIRQCIDTCPKGFYLNILNKHCQPCMQNCVHCLSSTYCIQWLDESLNPQTQLWSKYLELWIALIISGILILFATIYCYDKLCMGYSKKVPERRFNSSDLNENQNNSTANNLKLDAFQTSNNFKPLQPKKSFLQINQTGIKSFGRR